MTPTANPPRLAILAVSALLAFVAVSAQQAMPGMKMGPGFAQRERQVMPFSLEATLHSFANASDGGTETVTVKNTRDTKNLGLVRSHLKKEATKFSRGDFSDPAFLHGETMPGLALVRAGAKSGRIKIAYSSLPTGAHLRYTTKDAALVEALHAWFATQVADHGEHAAMGK